GNNYLYPLNASSSLTIGAGITIEGLTGDLGNTAGAITNFGVISANMTNGYFLMRAQPFVNNGVVEGVNGATLSISVLVNDTNGTVSIDGGGTLILGGAWQNSGTISENNSIVNLGGTIALTNLG